MTSEKQIQQSIARYLREHGAWVLNTHSVGYQRRGTPDLLVCWRGRFAALEVKRPRQRPTPLQARELRSIQEARGVASVVRSVGEVREILEAAENRGDCSMSEKAAGYSAHAHEAWRSMGDDDRDEFVRWAEDALTERWTLGNERYDSSRCGFQGEPLEHAIEEALDLLLYLWMLRRKENAR